MRNALALLTAASVLCLAGCSSSTPTGSSSTPNVLTGNWSLNATATTGPSLNFGTYLINSSGTLSGILHVTNYNSCYPITNGQPEDVAYTGTYNSTTGAVSITSSAVASQVISITGTANSGATALTSGNYTITGGCAAGDAGTITGNQDASLTSTSYTGTFTSNNTHTSTTINAGLEEDGPIQPHYFFDLSSALGGTIIYTGSPCFTNGAINTSFVTGTYVYASVTNSDSSTLIFTGYTDYLGKTITGTYTVTGGTCGGDSGTGSLTHP